MDGYYWYAGRSDDMFRVSGEWVSPIEVEGALIEHPAVLEAAVVARPSPLLSAYEKRLIAGLFDGNVKAGDKGKLSVTAEVVTCRISNVAGAQRSCELAFKKGKRSLKGRDANEVYATLASAGVVAEGDDATTAIHPRPA